MKALLYIFTMLICLPGYSQRQMENLNRGLIAVRSSANTAFVSWRVLGNDPEDIAFNLYRTTGNQKSIKLNKEPLTNGTNFTDYHVDFQSDNIYSIKVVVDKKESKTIEQFTLTSNTPERQYFSIPLQTPDGYKPNDGVVADLDGDGDYELVLHQTGRAHDNSHSGMTSEPILEAYELDGTLLWRINLGKNIREGAHYTQFMVYDLDGDGKAEVACKTADGTIDGKGKVIGDPKAIYVHPEGTMLSYKGRNGQQRERDASGYILSGPEYLTIFDGETGAELATTNYNPPRHPETTTSTYQQLNELWGDGYGNRVDRFLACVAYLDGKRPSLVMCRGYYTRAVLAAWNWRDGELSEVWTFDSKDGAPGNDAYSGQGNHSVSVGDVDEDGKDEIIYGAAVIDDDGTGLYSTGLGHGDALHYSDLDLTRPGKEIFDIQERFDDAGVHFRDARTGEILWKKPSVKAGKDGEGPGRGASFNIDPRYPGNESWVRGANIEGIFSAKGELISPTKPKSCNFAVWWDGDLLRELLDRNVIMKWDWENSKQDTLLVAHECRSNNGTKATPVLSADIFGDWREEVIWRTDDNNELRIYTTTIPTKHRFITLMHDPVYRLSVTWQNVAYNQPPHPGFYIGNDMEEPAKIEIDVIK